MVLSDMRALGWQSAHYHPTQPAELSNKDTFGPRRHKFGAQKSGYRSRRLSRKDCQTLPIKGYLASRPCSIPSPKARDSRQEQDNSRQSAQIDRGINSSHLTITQIYQIYCVNLTTIDRSTTPRYPRSGLISDNNLVSGL